MSFIITCHLNLNIRTDNLHLNSNILTDAPSSLHEFYDSLNLNLNIRTDLPSSS